MINRGSDGRFYIYLQGVMGSMEMFDRVPAIRDLGPSSEGTGNWEPQFQEIVADVLDGSRR